MKKTLVLLFLLIFISLVYRPVSAAEKVISLPDNFTDFPIHTAEIGCDDIISCKPSGQQDVNQLGCYPPDNNQNREWEIQQWKNQQSLCLDTDNRPYDSECAGADLAKETFTERVCYWKNQKKFHATVNNTNFSGGGCFANNGNLGNEPGGYGVSLMSGISRRSDWRSAFPNYVLGNLDNLFISANVSIDYMNDQLGQCSQPCDPVAQSCDSITFFGMNVFTHKFTNFPDAWQGTQFYNVGLYDNRPNLLNPAIEFKNCQLPTTTSAGTFVNTGQPITFYGLPAVYPGQGIKSYEIDVLPQIKRYIAECEQQLHGISNPDFNQYMLDGAFFANETYNKVIMSYTIIDPKIRLVYNAGFTPIIPNTPTPIPSATLNPTSTPIPPTSTPVLPSSTPVITPGDINHDGIVNIYDYNRLIGDFGKSNSSADINGNGIVDIYDYNTLVGNFGK